MPKFLHTADWQIGRLFSSFEAEDAHPLAEARLNAVERIASLANQHNVDGVLVAGDVFDAQTVSDRTIRRMFNAMSRFTGPWILISGNHDAALSESVWTRALRLGAVPAHVRLALTPELVLLPECNTAILPAPLTQRHTYTDTTAWFDQAQSPPGMLRIGVAHGSVQGILAEGIDSANPIAPQRAVQARLDYLALGDWHGCKRIDARTWYSGTPESDRFKSNESGYALLVEIAAAGTEPLVTPVQTGQFDWQQLELTLRVATDLDQLLDMLLELAPNSVLNLKLVGQLALAEHQQLTAALSSATARIRHLSADLSALILEPTDADIASLHADGYLAELIGELRIEQAGQSEAARTARAALSILTTALAQRIPAPASVAISAGVPG